MCRRTSSHSPRWTSTPSLAADAFKLSLRQRRPRGFKKPGPQVGSQLKHGGGCCSRFEAPASPRSYLAALTSRCTGADRQALIRQLGGACKSILANKNKFIDELENDRTGPAAIVQLAKKLRRSQKAGEKAGHALNPEARLRLRCARAPGVLK